MPVLVPLAFALLGLSVGSFLNLCMDRLPAGRSIVGPGSCCDTCQQPLRPRDLVPVLSYLWLKGRCRYCGARIPLRLPLVELATGALFGLLAWRFGLNLELAIALAYACLFLLIFVIDVEQRLILYSVLVPGLVLAFAFSFFWGGFEGYWPRLGPGFVLSSLLGGATGFGILLVIYLVFRGAMGRGDVYLAGLIGMVNGYPLVLVALMVGIVAGGLAGVFLLATRLAGRKDVVPYGPFLAVGAMVSLVWGERIVEWYRGLTAFA